MAGAAHADTYTVSAGRHDDGTLSAERLAELLRPTTNLMIGQTDTPINAGPQQHYVAQAALAHLTRWAADGAAPPAAPRLDARRRRDGLPPRRRTASRSAASARRGWRCRPPSCRGLGQSGESFAMLFGRTEPFDEATLADAVPRGQGRVPGAVRRRRSTRPSPPASSSRRTATEILAVAAASYPLRLADG